MHRRDFIKSSCGLCVALGSGALVSALLESCGTSLSVLKTTALNNVITIPLADFQQDSFKMVRVSNYNYDLAVQKQADGSYLALVLMCTHAHHSLTKTGDSYYCSLHGSQFANTGQVKKGPAEKNLIRLPVHSSDTQLSITLLPAG
ncbi:MAG: Rieske 2Fe-2S domain-containing protein [Bacteroidota bacterium]